MQSNRKNFIMYYILGNLQGTVHVIGMSYYEEIHSIWFDAKIAYVILGLDIAAIKINAMELQKVLWIDSSLSQHRRFLYQL